MIVLLAVTTAASPLRWTRSQAREPEPTPTTIIPWTGRAKMPGAFILSRINTDFINATCSKFITALEKTKDVVAVLEKTKLGGGQHPIK